MTNKYNYTLPFFKRYDGKVSFFTRFHGSITVEASLAVPIFFFAVLCLVCLFEIMCVDIAVRSGLQYAGKMIAQESYPLPVLRTTQVEEYVVHAIGEERLERSLITGGSTGIHCEDSYLSLRTGIGKLTARYRFQIPVPYFFTEGLEKEQSIRVKAWTGYEKEFLGLSGEETVYVTETGMVYHRDYHCTYLDLSIQMVSKNTIEEHRNLDGEKYYACWICGGGKKENVYITSSGDKYHGSLSCSGLKRTIYAIPLSEAIGKGACTRCGH